MHVVSDPLMFGLYESSNVWSSAKAFSKTFSVSTVVIVEEYRQKRSGPVLDPCGMEKFIVLMSEYSLLIQTYIWRSFR